MKSFRLSLRLAAGKNRGNTNAAATFVDAIQDGYIVVSGQKGRLRKQRLHLDTKGSTAHDIVLMDRGRSLKSLCVNIICNGVKTSIYER